MQLIICFHLSESSDERDQFLLLPQRNASLGQDRANPTRKLVKRPVISIAVVSVQPCAKRFEFIIGDFAVGDDSPEEPVEVAHFGGQLTYRPTSKVHRPAKLKDLLLLGAVDSAIGQHALHELVGFMKRIDIGEIHMIGEPLFNRFGFMHGHRAVRRYATKEPLENLKRARYVGNGGIRSGFR